MLCELYQVYENKREKGVRKMKKRLIALLMSAIMVSGVLTGCGGNDAESNADVKTETNTKVEVSNDTIAFSELFKHDVIIYTCGGSFDGKDEEIYDVDIFYADSKYEGYDDFLKLGDVAQKEDDEIISTLSDVWVIGNYKLGILSDSTGNSTDTESLLVRATYDSRHDNSRRPGWVGYTGGISNIGYFVGHVTVYDDTFMMFEKTNNGDTSRYLIRDTEETKDKTVYFDPIGTEGIVVDMNAEEAFADYVETENTYVLENDYEALDFENMQFSISGYTYTLGVTTLRDIVNDGNDMQIYDYEAFEKVSMASVLDGPNNRDKFENKCTFGEESYLQISINPFDTESFIGDNIVRAVYVTEFAEKGMTKDELFAKYGTGQQADNNINYTDGTGKVYTYTYDTESGVIISLYMAWVDVEE